MTSRRPGRQTLLWESKAQLEVGIFHQAKFYIYLIRSLALIILNNSALFILFCAFSIFGIFFIYFIHIFIIMSVFIWWIVKTFANIIILVFINSNSPRISNGSSNVQITNIIGSQFYI